VELLRSRDCFHTDEMIKLLFQFETTISRSYVNTLRDCFHTQDVHKKYTTWKRTYEQEHGRSPPLPQLQLSDPLLQVSSAGTGHRGDDSVDGFHASEAGTGESSHALQNSPSPARARSRRRLRRRSQLNTPHLLSLVAPAPPPVADGLWIKQLRAAHRQASLTASPLLDFSATTATAASSIPSAQAGAPPFLSVTGEDVRPTHTQSHTDLLSTVSLAATASSLAPPLLAASVPVSSRDRTQQQQAVGMDVDLRMGVSSVLSSLRDSIRPRRPGEKANASLAPPPINVQVASSQCLQPTPLSHSTTTPALLSFSFTPSTDDTTHAPLLSPSSFPLGADPHLHHSLEDLLSPTPLRSAPPHGGGAGAGPYQTACTPLMPTAGQVLIPSAQKVTSAPRLCAVPAADSELGVSSAISSAATPQPSVAAPSVPANVQPNSAPAVDPVQSRATDLMRDLFHKFLAPAERSKKNVGRSASNDNALLF
jgi:hypothetical protein